MDRVKFCIFVSALFGASSFSVVLGASQNSSSNQVTTSIGTATSLIGPSTSSVATAQLSSTTRPAPSHSPTATLQPEPSFTPVVEVRPMHFTNFLSFDNGSYNMSWMFNSSMDTLHFLVEVRTTGWIGFGVANKAPNNMKDYDVAVGGVWNGTGYLKDYWTIGHVQPRLDLQQDWMLTHAGEENGVTTLRFYRQLDTGDSENDTVIQPAMPPFIVWAYHLTDDVDQPTNFTSHVPNGAKGFKNQTLLPTSSPSSTPQPLPPLSPTPQPPPPSSTPQSPPPPSPTPQPPGTPLLLSTPRPPPPPSSTPQSLPPPSSTPQPPPPLSSTPQPPPPSLSKTQPPSPPSTPQTPSPPSPTPQPPSPPSTPQPPSPPSSTPQPPPPPPPSSTSQPPPPSSTSQPPPPPSSTPQPPPPPSSTPQPPPPPSSTQQPPPPPSSTPQPPPPPSSTTQPPPPPSSTQQPPPPPSSKQQPPPPPSSTPQPPPPPSSTQQPPPPPSSTQQPPPPPSSTPQPPPPPPPSSTPQPPPPLSTSQPQPSPSTPQPPPLSTSQPPPSSSTSQPSPPSSTPQPPPPSSTPQLPPSPSSSLPITYSKQPETKGPVTSSKVASLPSATVPFTTPSTEGSKKFEGRGSVQAEWESDYANSSTDKYKRLQGDLKSHLTAVLKKSYKDNFIDVDVKNFKSGSIIFDFIVYLKATTSVSEDTLADVIEKGDGSSKFTISGVSVKQVAGPKPTTSPTDKPKTGLEKWIIVLIATGVVIVFLLIALLAVVRQNRRLRSLNVKNHTVNHHENDPFVQPRMYSMSAKEMYQLSGPEENAGHTSGHALKTFSSDNEGFVGASNAAYEKTDENKTERDNSQLLDGDKSDASDEDREDDVHYLPGAGFI